MAETFTRLPLNNGDNRVWGPYVLKGLQNNFGLMTSYLYNDSGTLKIKAGVIGINDGTNEGTITITADKTIDLSLCSVSNWVKIEVSVSGTTATFTASDLSGGTDPAALHATFKNAWRGDRGGFYITATKRTIGLAWKNAAGVLEGIVNCLPFIDGWSGYCQSNDANDYPYFFDKRINQTSEGTPNDSINLINFSNLKKVIYVDSLGVETTKRIKTKVFEIGDWNMDTTETINIAHGISDYTKIRNMFALIKTDIGAIFYINRLLNLNIAGSISIVNSNIVLYRVAGETFEHVDFSDTSFNRGFVNIEYEE